MINRNTENRSRIVSLAQNIDHVRGDVLLRAWRKLSSPERFAIVDSALERDANAFNDEQSRIGRIREAIALTITVDGCWALEITTISEVS